MNIGEKIRQERKKKKMSMKELGNIIGVSEQAISQYERGLRNIPLEKVIKISEALNISLNRLMIDKQFTYSQQILSFFVNERGLSLETLEDETQVCLSQLDALYHNKGYANLGTYINLYGYFDKNYEESLNYMISDLKINSMYNNNGKDESLNIIKKFFMGQIDLHDKTIEEVTYEFIKELCSKLNNQEIFNDIIKEFPEILFAKYISNLEYTLEKDQITNELKKIMFDKLDDFINNYPTEAIFEINNFMDFVKYKYTKKKIK